MADESPVSMPSEFLDSHDEIDLEGNFVEPEVDVPREPEVDVPRDIY
jgi:hypothetical protein